MADEHKHKVSTITDPEHFVLKLNILSIIFVHVARPTSTLRRKVDYVT